MHDSGVGTPSTGPGTGDACRSCGGRMGERWTPAKTATVRFCTNSVCGLYGVPSMRQARHAVTVNDNGEVFEVR